jgi:dipeptidyl aminopeptidase/acylaminoacyl peptidase
LLAIAAALLVAAPARADIFAVAPIVAPGHSDIDVGLIDASTGASLPLPAGVNTTAANENHPSISTDGKRLVFERRDRAAGTDRLIVADLSTGQTMDLFNAFDTATLHPTSPSINPDGDWVTTGSEGSGLHGRSLANFPNSVSAETNEEIFPGDELVDPTQTDPSDTAPFAFRRNLPLAGGGTRGQLVVENVPGASAPVAASTASFSVAHPSIAVSGGHRTIVYSVHTLDAGGSPGPDDIGFCVIFLHAGNPCGLGQGLLPPLVNSGRDESRPAFTPDGRYIGFIRDEANGHERLYVFDTETQTLIDPDGSDLGLVATRDTGNLSLYEKFVLKVTSFPSFGTLNATLINPAPIGLLVQRVVGHHRLLGRRVPKLKAAGRIPLGKFRRGHHRIHWRGRVNGHRLRPGLYQFTPRALTEHGKVRDLGKPRLFRVR